jgi:hypothetical protein
VIFPFGTKQAFLGVETEMKKILLLCVTAMLLLPMAVQAGLWDPALLNPSFESVENGGTAENWGYIIDDWYENEASSMYSNFYEQASGIGLTGDGLLWAGAENGGMFYQPIGNYDGEETITVTLLIGSRWGDSFVTGEISLYAGGLEADAGDGVDLSTITGVVQLDTTTVTTADGTLVSTNVYEVSVELSTGTSATAGDLLWLEFGSVLGKDYFDNLQVESPNKAIGPVPENGDGGISPAQILSWTAPSIPGVKFNVYLDENDPPTTLKAPETSDSNYDPVPDLEYLTTYFWRVDTVDSNSTNTGDIWTFDTGGKATNPIPSDSSNNANVPTVDLAWTGETFATSYKVYAGKSVPLDYIDEVATPQYPGLDTPDRLTTYYWRIDEYTGTTKLATGDTWSFTTKDYPLQCIPGDLSGNCVVDMVDLVLFMPEWLQLGPSQADIAGENGVNLEDFAVIAGNWQQEKQVIQLVINEFVAVNHFGITDEDGDTPDWIEIYNVAGGTVSLDNWYLTDDADNLDKWQFPDMTIGADEYLVVFASSENRRDPASELHTNFSLRSGGEYLALVRPDGVTIEHSYNEFPPQYYDIAYGLDDATISTTNETLIQEYVTAKALIPVDGLLDTTWTGGNEPFDDSGWIAGSTGIGYGYGTLINLDVTAMQNNNKTVYARVPFYVEDPSSYVGLTLRMKYEDGFAAYLNGQPLISDRAPDYAGLTWQSGSTSEHHDGDAIVFVDYDVTFAKDMLIADTNNILAFHGLNYTLGSSDLLILPELVATATEGLRLNEIGEGYFLTPTPGAANSGATENLGPVIRNMTDSPPQPDENEDLVITAEITQTLALVDEVMLYYRVMYGTEISVTMYDDGSHGDAAAGDGIYGAAIPHSAYSAGEMVRWYITADDTEESLSRNPLFPYPTDSPEYCGTVVADPSVTTQLPLIEWFVQSTSASEIDSGTRGSTFFNGMFYDNIYIHRRGGSTATAYGRVHQKFNFNRGYKFEYDPSKPKVNEINLNHTYSDKAYLRQSLAFDMYDWCGNPGSDSFVMRGQRNGQFHGVFAFIEEPEEEMLEREGLDPDGALYKMYNTFNAGGGAEKKTRRWEGRSDLDDFCNAINNPTGTVLHNNIFDQVDLPRTLNYLVATVLCHQNDHPHKNHYLYRDSDGSGEWFFMPWDNDLTYGYNWIGTSFSDTIYADDDQTSSPGNAGNVALEDIKPSHPFIGRSDACEWNGFWNKLTDALLRDTTVQEMFKRRLRTVMDELLKAPGTDPNELFIENRIDDMVTAMAPDVALDYAKWADPWRWEFNYSFSQSIDIVKDDYLDVRRTHLFVTHNIDNVGSYPISGSFSAAIPNAQPASPNITIDHTVEYNPASYNQDEEYLRLNNNESYYVEISNWQLTDAVRHTFLPGTVIPAGGSLYVSPQVATFRARSSSPTGGEGNFVQGNYNGHLSSWGETINLLDNNDSLIDTHTYTASPSDQQRYLRITEIMYHPAQGSTYNEEEYEYIELKNIGVSSLLLDNVKLSDGIYYAFADSAGLYLAAGDRIVIVRNQLAFAERYSTGGMNIAAGEYTGYLDNGGEDIKLDDYTNSTILEFDYNDSRYPITDGSGFSLTIVNETNSDLDSWDDMDNWHPSSIMDGTPDTDDTGHVADNGAIVINEVLTHTDEPTYGDWIELHNTTGSPINIGGWFLSDNDNNFKKYKIASGTSIPGNGYKVFNSTETFRNALDLGSYVQFGLSELGEEVYFSSGSGGDLSGGYSIVEDFGVSANGVTFGRYVKSAASGYNVDFVAMSSTTKDNANSAPRVGPVVITELMYNSPELDYQAEYIEIKNISGGTVLLYDSSYPSNTWKFTNGVDYTFPAGISLANNEYLLITRDDPVAFRSRYETEWSIPGGVTILGPYDGKLDNGGEKLDLSMPNDPDPITEEFEYIRVDRVNYNDKAPWPTTADGEGDSLDRITDSDYGNDVANWQAGSPTPGL